MPENDVSKMKVADLKRELKLRGLPITGNKMELQDRLQTALLDGDLSLEDTAISGEDLLEDVLTDEEEKAILTLPPDENELLKSPTSDLNRSFSTEKPIDASVTQPKKVVLKRKSSITPLSIETPAVVKEDLAASDDLGSDLSSAKVAKADPIPKQVIKVSALTLEERMQMRAKKFGIEENKISIPNTNSTPVVSSGAATAGAAVLKDADPKQIETLKKRAERFGCVVSSTIAKITADERLEKRKQRFGDISVDSGKPTPAGGKDAYAEKARQRLERFKTATK